MENMLSDILSQYDRWEIEQYTKDTLIEAVKEQTFSCSLLVLDVFEPGDEMLSGSGICLYIKTVA